MTSVKKRTVKTIHEVRVWLETTPHHIAMQEPETGVATHLVLRGYTEQLRIPVSLWNKCYIKPAASPLDNRLYCWDHDRERRVVFPRDLPSAAEVIHRCEYVFKKAHRRLASAQAASTSVWDDLPFGVLAPNTSTTFAEFVINGLEEEFGRALPAELLDHASDLTFNKLLNFVSGEAYTLWSSTLAENNER